MNCFRVLTGAAPLRITKCFYKVLEGEPVKGLFFGDLFQGAELLLGFSGRPPVSFQQRRWTETASGLQPELLKGSQNHVIVLLNSGVWRSLAARLVWDQEVGGSNPPTPTILAGFFKAGLAGEEVAGTFFLC